MTKSEDPQRRDGDWESRALKIVVTLDSAAEQLASLIDEIRRQRKDQEDPPDARPEP